MKSDDRIKFIRPHFDAKLGQLKMAWNTALVAVDEAAEHGKSSTQPAGLRIEVCDTGLGADDPLHLQLQTIATGPKRPMAVPLGFSTTEFAGTYRADPQVGLPVELMMFRVFFAGRPLPVDVACHLARLAGEAKQAYRSRGLATFIDRDGSVFCVPDDRDCHQVEISRIMGGNQWIHPDLERPLDATHFSHAWFPARMLHQLLSQHGDFQRFLEWGPGGVVRVESKGSTQHPPEVVPPLASSAAPNDVVEIVDAVLAGDRDISLDAVLDVLARHASGKDETRALLHEAAPDDLDHLDLLEVEFEAVVL